MPGSDRADVGTSGSSGRGVVLQCQTHHLGAIDVFLDRLCSALSHIKAVVERILTLFFRGVPEAVILQRLYDAHAEVCEVSLSQCRLDDLLQLCKKSSSVLSRFKSRFRLVCGPPTVSRLFRNR